MSHRHLLVLAAAWAALPGAGRATPRPASDSVQRLDVAVVLYSRSYGPGGVTWRFAELGRLVFVDAPAP